MVAHAGLMWEVLYCIVLKKPIRLRDGVGDAWDGVSGVLDARYISHLVALKLRNRKFVLVSLPI